MHQLARLLISPVGGWRVACERDRLLYVGTAICPEPVGVFGVRRAAMGPETESLLEQDVQGLQLLKASAPR